ncbi:hypothetical protein HOD83_00590 [Candidatus Woesearchaeota archaeon]|nr:hypothetical protein [Candidatus Woesearchaeota archaeon]MBT4114576.1 hypothetical protein [Candidatus Woesearchaeota archaeon]MBT4248074.1 hypothetical protein [Candidatus Woesearchaeota archaeon]
MIIPQSVQRVLFWLAEGGELSQPAIKNLSQLSERSIRYALSILKQEGLVIEVINLIDVRKKKYKVCASVSHSLFLQKKNAGEKERSRQFDKNASVAQVVEHSSCKRAVGGANPPRGLESI